MRFQSVHHLPINQAYWPFPEQTRFQPKAARSAAHSARITPKKRLQTLLSKLYSSTDPHVWSTRNAAGETVWSAEDLTSRKTIYNISEVEMRVWLEERYQF